MKPETIILMWILIWLNSCKKSHDKITFSIGLKLHLFVCLLVCFSFVLDTVGKCGTATTGLERKAGLK